MTNHHTQYINDTLHWIEQAVIGLNLCPFAKAVVTKERLKIVVSDADNETALIEDLALRLAELASLPETEVETTVLIHPYILTDFDDYNQFLDEVDLLLEKLELDGELQVASFHPDYQFADVPADDITNYTNRSPYPCLHLLRESSIDRAVRSTPDAADIYERNQETLKKLGLNGWQALGLKK